jgi:hypothetical protein
MAGFTVPNASEFGTSIQSLDQAEPDSLDFTILGDDNYGVLSGCDITVYSLDNGSALLDAGEVLIDGEFGIVSSLTLTFTAPNVDPRFDIIVAEKSGSSFIYNTVVGTPDASNPVFPTLASDQVPLYALYRKSGVTFNGLSVVDKRKFVKLPIRTGAAVPTFSTSDGELYVRVGTAPESGQSSMYVYVDGSWQNVAKYEGAADEGLNPFLLAGL